MERKETIAIRKVSNGYIIKNKNIEHIERSIDGCCSLLAETLRTVIPGEINGEITLEFILIK